MTRFDTWGPARAENLTRFDMWGPGRAKNLTRLDGSCVCWMHKGSAAGKTPTAVGAGHRGGRKEGGMGERDKDKERASLRLKETAASWFWQLLPPQPTPTDPPVPSSGPGLKLPQLQTQTACSAPPLPLSGPRGSKTCTNRTTLRVVKLRQVLRCSGLTSCAQL